jgi:hypothetical protein
MSSNQGTGGHEWGFVRGMTTGSQRRQHGDERLNPPTTTSPGDHQRTRETVTVFTVGDHYLLTGPFTDDDLLDTLEPYYNRQQGRFEVGQEAFLDVERRIVSAGYDVSLVTDPSEYAVVVDQHAPHPDAVVAESVFDVSVEGQNVFVLPSTGRVAAVVDETGRPLSKTPIRLTLSAAADVGPVTVRDVAAE